MELIRISEDKIKISLSKAELDAYDLSMEQIDQKSIRTQSAFRELFIEAKEQTGFDAHENRVFVQIFRARNGGCEIFVSKILQKDNNRTRNAPKYINAYHFDGLDGLLSACRTLKRIGYSDPSFAYASEGDFCLLLDTDSELALDCAAELCEYTELLSEYYPDEHFSAIRKKDAVQVLSKL